MKRQELLLTAALQLLLLFFMNRAAFGMMNGDLVSLGQPIAKSELMLMRKTFFDQRHGECSATLISPNLVLTAAHCVSNLSSPSLSLIPADQLEVYFGNYDGEHPQPSLAGEVEAVVYADERGIPCYENVATHASWIFSAAQAVGVALPN